MRGLARVQRAAVEVALSGGGRAAAVRSHRLVEARARAARALHCKYYLVTPCYGGGHTVRSRKIKFVYLRVGFALVLSACPISNSVMIKLYWTGYSD